MYLSINPSISVFKLVIIHVSNDQNTLIFSLDSVQTIVKEVIQLEGQICDEVSIYFVEQLEIQRLHQEFFDDPTPTDCISFPMDEEELMESYRVLGDVFVCPQVAVEYAKENHLDALEETTLYIVHGLLHLLGYDDIEEQEILHMRQAESKHMAHLKHLNLHLKTSLS